MSYDFKYLAALWDVERQRNEEFESGPASKRRVNIFVGDRQSYGARERLS
jgi:hypothetical protein